MGILCILSGGIQKYRGLSAEFKEKGSEIGVNRRVYIKREFITGGSLKFCFLENVLFDGPIGTL